MESEPIISSEGITSQILIKTVSNTHSLMTTDSDATNMRIAPRDYTSADSNLSNIRIKDHVSRSGSDRGSDGTSSVPMMIGSDVGQEHEDGDVTDRYLIKESDVKDKSILKITDST